MYDAGVAATNGTEKDRRLHGEWLERVRGERSCAAAGGTEAFEFRKSASGHNVLMVEPEVVAEGIRWGSMWSSLAY